MEKDCTCTITLLLENIMVDRDTVHHQISCAAAKHLTAMNLASGVTCLGCKDTVIHLLNFVVSCAFKESPHVIQATCNPPKGL